MVEWFKGALRWVELIGPCVEGDGMGVVLTDDTLNAHRGHLGKALTI